MIIQIKRIANPATVLAEGEISYVHLLRTLKIGDDYPILPRLVKQVQDYWSSAITITGVYRFLHLCIFRSNIEVCDAVITIPTTSISIPYTYYAGTMQRNKVTYSSGQLTHNDSTIRRIEIYKEK